MTHGRYVRSLFATGKSAMMVAGSWLNTNIQNEEPGSELRRGYLPQLQNAASPLGGGNIMMMKDDNREASSELTEILTQQREFQEILCRDAGFISPREDAVAESTLWLNDPILSVYTEQLKLTEGQGPHPEMAEDFQVRFSLRTRMCSRVPNQWTMH